MTRVAVVGAGFAGLAAADALARVGIEVTVLEARDRVGGRVCSRELENGSIVELGAEFVLPGNDTVLAFAARFGLGLWDKGMRYGDREPRGGIGVSRATLAEALTAVRLALRAGHAGVSAAELLDGLALDAGAREAIRARVEVSSATTADRVDAAELAGLAAHSDDPAPSVAGGNQRIADALARELGAAVRLSSPVVRIAWDDDAVRLAAGGDELLVERVVLAVPASVLGRIAFQPALPEPLRSSYAAVEYGHAAKLFVPLGAPTPPGAVLSVPERYWTWTATADGGRVQPVVHAFAGSSPALDRLRVVDGPGEWLGSLARLRPDLALAPADAVLSTWDDDPWVAAAYSASAPPVAAWAGTGPFHACGEHTAGPLASLMEGALVSGLRAAQEVADALAGSRLDPAAGRLPGS
ncbi:MAG: FAD-dependent oxidoreductase [Thermoleophilia bacterium]|nr:FAD-dependent oxidoreductase [Thermoleophilia bacterium]